MSLNDDSYNENTCVVCFKNVEIFSIGDCDHPVCFECSTRMRVLCRQNECPICRHDMQKVIFTNTVKPFKELELSCGTKHLLDRKFKIVFQTTEIQHAYNTLLAHVCSKCPGRHAFQTFNNLRDHMRKEHELFYCDLCVDNLKILTHERQCYTRKELATHRRHGDPDDRSHRGHPLCEFCNERYMDNDELYRHLRRDHLFCHFCDADGYHQYYDTYDVLRRHFRDEHYLCEEGTCYDEKFTSVFRSDIDLKAHRASVHGKTMTKAAAKQARTLEVEFTVKRRPRTSDQRRGGSSRASRYQNCSDEEEGAVGGLPTDYYQNSQQTSGPLPFVAKNDEFPTLGGSSAPASQLSSFRKPGVTIRTMGGTLAMTKEDFPALGPEATASVSLRVNSGSAADRARGVSIHVNHRPSGVVTTVSSNKSREKDPFPALSGKTVAPPPTQWSTSSRQSESKFSSKNRSSEPAQKPSSQSQSKNSKSYHFEDEDFPPTNSFQALRGNIPSHIANLAATQWSSGREPDPKLSVNKTKPQPPPKPPQPKTFHIEDDFPSLNSRFDASCSFSPESSKADNRQSHTKEKKESSVSIPVSNEWVKFPNSVTSVENISSDSDVGSKKSSKKKKNKSKAKTDSSSETIKSAPPKTGSNNNNLESSKKNKQKTEPKSKAKHLKVKEELTPKCELVVPNGDGNIKTQDISERKRSELKIESLNGQLENNVNNNDFPNLTNNRLPPGFSSLFKFDPPVPPPGFQSTSGPPPGFSITLNSVARPPNNLTFTSSSGQNFPISSEESSGDVSKRVYQYVSPPNMTARNTALLSRVTGALDSPEALKDFLQMSARYRQGSLSAQAYYDRCRSAMPVENFTQIFQELLVLLPDIDKQQELWKVVNQTNEWKLNVCAVCSQVVASADFRHHHTTHSLENHFPALSNGVVGSNAWNKK